MAIRQDVRQFLELLRAKLERRLARPPRQIVQGEHGVAVPVAAGRHFLVRARERCTD